ncbi:alpha/beta hydrolase [Flavobacterium olei]|uniref:alpha/beta hydrolase n=1 Tax=Flavobacterium olei TaxID=1886782 RepID=UPI00321C1D3A
MALTKEWDKVFPKSEKVNHSKVTFKNGFGIILAADLYIPKVADGKLPAIAVSGPFGACKEQAAGLYAQTMAEHGFITLAFDPSFTGESSGTPRQTTSPDINTDDFMSAVDCLSIQSNVDADRIGIIGVCGWGSIALNAAAADTRIKATVSSTMYNMTRVKALGSEEERYAARDTMSKQRTADALSGNYVMEGGIPNPENLPADAPAYLKELSNYYKTSRAYHERSGNNGMHIWGTQAYANADFLHYSNEIRTPVLVIHGGKANSRFFSEDAFKYMIKGNRYPENKELYIVPDATHVDLYDGGDNDYIPWDKMVTFFESNL